MMITLDLTGSISIESVMDMTTRVAISVALLGFILNLIIPIMGSDGEPAYVLKEANNKINEHLITITGHDEMFPDNLSSFSVNMSIVNKTLN